MPGLVVLAGIEVIASPEPFWGFMFGNGLRPQIGTLTSLRWWVDGGDADLGPSLPDHGVTSTIT